MIFTLELVQWVLYHYQELSRGIEPEPVGDENIVQRKGFSHRAPFENPCCTAGEVSARVKMCGLDGYLVEELYGMNNGYRKNIEIISSERHMPYRDVDGRIKKVLWYCTDDVEKSGSGIKNHGRRRQSYGDWKQDRKYRRANPSGRREGE